MTGPRQEGGGQLQLLPARAPEARSATLPLSELDGFEHAVADRQLIEQIAKLGLLQPIVVTSSAQRFKVIEGRRRAQAVQRLAAGGRWPRPPRVDAVIVENVDAEGVMPAGMMLALHASRRPSPASELAAIERILAQGGEHTEAIREIASQTGMPAQTVRRRLRLRELVGSLRVAFDDGAIPVSVAEAAARLSAEQQRRLERLFAAGEPLTLPVIREIARERAATAAVELPGGLFADRQASWQLTVRGHLQAALQAIPSGEGGRVLAAGIADVISRLEAEGQPSHEHHDPPLGSGASEGLAMRAMILALIGAAALAACSAAGTRNAPNEAARPPGGATSRSPGALAYSTASGQIVQRMPAPGSCRYRGQGVFVRPDPGCTPGALNPAVTQRTVGRTICRPGGYTVSIRPPESVTEPEKRAAIRAYGINVAVSSSNGASPQPDEVYSGDRWLR